MVLNLVVAGVNDVKAGSVITTAVQCIVQFCHRIRAVLEQRLLGF
jgi:hypothetical protein